MSAAKEFREFILRGNVVDLAVGVIIGSAFGAIVTALVNDIVTPIIGIFVSDPKHPANFNALNFSIHGSVFKVGEFLDTVISFLIAAAVVFFFVVKPVNYLMSLRKTDTPTESATRWPMGGASGPPTRPSANPPALCFMSCCREGERLRYNDGMSLDPTLDVKPTGRGKPPRVSTLERRKLIPFGWYGGKFSHLDWLLPLLPAAHHYCEPFARSGAVLLNRPPSPVETYNDLDGEVVNFFRVLREQKDALTEAIGLTPFSREEFGLACALEPDLAPLECARRFYVHARQVRTGLAHAT